MRPSRKSVPGAPFWVDGERVRPRVRATFPECPLCKKPARYIQKPYGGLGLAIRRLWWPCCDTVSEPKDFLEWAVVAATDLVGLTQLQGAWPDHAKVPQA
jgi:hypothetical protein